MRFAVLVGSREAKRAQMELDAGMTVADHAGVSELLDDERDGARGLRGVQDFRPVGLAVHLEPIYREGTGTQPAQSA